MTTLQALAAYACVVIGASVIACLFFRAVAFLNRDDEQ